MIIYTYIYTYTYIYIYIIQTGFNDFLQIATKNILYVNTFDIF